MQKMGKGQDQRNATMRLIFDHIAEFVVYCHNLFRLCCNLNVIIIITAY